MVKNNKIKITKKSLDAEVTKTSQSLKNNVASSGVSPVLKESKFQSKSEFQLNKAQEEAVKHGDGPLLIIAGAGTGKTRVITQRIIHLIKDEDVNTANILALTFTQKAAQEMEERVDVALPYGYSDISISTFHSFCDRILKQEAFYVGMDPNYVMMTQAQEYIYLRGKLFDLPLDRFRPRGNPTKFMGAILSHFSRLQDEDLSPQDYQDFVKKAKHSKSFDSDELEDYQELANVYEKYSEMKQNDSRLGFGDLVPFTLKLFREKPEVLNRYKEKYKYILVDEFQDTNWTQNELVKVLAGDEANITVVGDDDQAIYKFRGAAISNIMEFNASFPESKKIVLTENYRSHQDILDSAYKLIRVNDPDRLEVKENIDKRLTYSGTDALKIRKNSENSAKSQVKMSLNKLSGNVVRRIHSYNDVEEAESVVKEIEKLVTDESLNLNYSDIAILVRANGHSEAFVQSLKYHKIQFTFPGPKGLYNREEIKDLIAILKVIADYSDDISMYRVLALPIIGLSPREFVDIQKIARKNKTSLFEFLEDLFSVKIGERGESDELVDVADDQMEELAKSLLKKDSQENLKKLLDVFEDVYRMLLNKNSVGQILYEFITKIGYIEDLVQNNSVANEWKISNLNKYFDTLKAFEAQTDDPNVYEYLDYLEYSLEIGENPNVDPIDMVDYDAVNILTIHGSKGLEFPVVFLVNLVNDRFPTRRRSDPLPIPEGLIKESLPEGDEHLQEERRLFYVGITRAQNLLYLTSADYYATGVRKKKQSVFLHDLGLVEDSVSLKPEVSVKSLYSNNELKTPEIPSEMRSIFLDKILRNLSYSHISTFNKCPYQFYFKYFLGIPGKASSSKSFGTTIHITLKDLYERLIRFREGFPGVEQIPTLDDLLEIYTTRWIRAGYENKTQELQQFKLGKEMLKNYYESMFDGGCCPFKLEDKFRVSMGDFYMTGVVDRIDLVGDKLRIYDYKTGRLPKDQKEVEKDLQLPIYIMAVEQKFGKKVEKAGLLYLDGPALYEVEPSELNREKSIQEVSKTLEEIKNMEFKPNPNMLCKFCDYRNICDYANM